MLWCRRFFFAPGTRSTTALVRHIRLVVEYDGTSLRGWQRQANGADGAAATSRRRSRKLLAHEVAGRRRVAHRCRRARARAGRELSHRARDPAARDPARAQLAAAATRSRSATRPRSPTTFIRASRRPASTTATRSWRAAIARRAGAIARGTTPSRSIARGDARGRRARCSASTTSRRSAPPAARPSTTIRRIDAIELIERPTGELLDRRCPRQRVPAQHGADPGRDPGRGRDRPAPPRPSGRDPCLEGPDPGRHHRARRTASSWSRSATTARVPARPLCKMRPTQALKRCPWPPNQRRSASVELEARAAPGRGGPSKATSTPCDPSSNATPSRSTAR